MSFPQIFPSVMQFGAVDDGTNTDDTLAFELMANYCNTNSICGYVDNTINGFSTVGNHTFNYGLKGVNGWSSIVYITHPTNNIITSNSVYGGEFSGVTYRAACTRVGGAYIVIDAPPSSVSYSSVIEKNKFIGGFIDIYLRRATAAIVEKNMSMDFRNNFLYIENRDFPDNGDHFISGNTWDTSYIGAQSGIFQLNAGGSKIIGNKGGRGLFGYEMCLNGNSSQSTSILLIEGNSFENQTAGQIRLRREIGSTATFNMVTISGNEFAGGAVGNPAVTLDDNTQFIDRIIFSNNHVQFMTIGLAAYKATNVFVHGNIFKSFGGSSVGISFDAGVTGRIGYNGYTNVTTPIINASQYVSVGV